MQKEPQTQPPRLEKPVRITEQVWPEGTVPVVSVFCITYNHADFIREAIEGFLMQETTFPVEIFIHDDASTDGTAEIVQEYAAKYPQLFRTVLQSENQYSKARFSFIFEQFEKQRGEFIAFCEGDDYWTSPHKLQKQVTLLEQDPSVALVFHNAWVRHRKSSHDYFMNRGLEKDRFSLQDIIQRDWFMASASLVFRKFPTLPLDLLGYARGGDMLVQIGACRFGDALFLDEIMSVYRRHEGGISYSYHQANRVHHEEMAPNHLWMYWVLGETVLPVGVRPVIERRVRQIMTRVLSYAVSREGVALPCKGARLREYLHSLLRHNKPDVLAEKVLGDGGGLTAIIDGECRSFCARERRRRWREAIKLAARRCMPK